MLFGLTCIYVEVAVRFCPQSHPYAYLDGSYCCKYGEENYDARAGVGCDGGPISLTSTCCKDESYQKCPGSKCKGNGGTIFWSLYRFYILFNIYFNIRFILQKKFFYLNILHIMYWLKFYFYSCSQTLFGG